MSGAGVEAGGRSEGGQSAGPGALGRGMRVAAAGLVVLACAVVPAYFVLLAWTTAPEGPWDDDRVTYSAYMCWFALVTAGFPALPALLSVRRGVLRRWWYALPALLVVAALSRLTVFAPTA